MNLRQSKGAVIDFFGLVIIYLLRLSVYYQFDNKDIARGRNKILSISLWFRFYSVRSGPLVFG